MSADTVDDLHASEDGWGAAVVALQRLRANPEDVDALVGADVAIDTYVTYCRPTCGFRWEGECQDDEETCGCPCGHEESP